MHKSLKPEGDGADRVGEINAQGKRSYHPPRLVVYGNLSHIVMAKGGNLGDGKGVPSTRIK
jgi:hypothetical protein